MTEVDATYVAHAVAADEPTAMGMSDALERLAPDGVGTFEIEDGAERWEVVGYFSAPPDAAALALLSAAFDADPFIVSTLAPRDWVAQVRRELTPVRAGRFVVFGGHDRAQVPQNALKLEIEAATAFGTGHHGTTEGCLAAIDRLAKSGFRPRCALDVGCGTGVLAMGAALIWPLRAAATDLDPVAARVAAVNVRANGLAPRVRTGAAPGVRSALARSAAPVDLVLANILARPLGRLAPGVAALQPRGGVVILSGLLTRQKPYVSGMYQAWGYAPCFTVEMRGWSTLVLSKGCRLRV